MNERRKEQKAKPAPERPREQAERKSKPDREHDPFDEQSLDDVLRDCPL